MAFNFNWSPLTADEDFYQRARNLLTAALNKSPKPPIIVDDILVTELNLGSIPPELEILEIGDLAEDRFRGIFKMCYSGDAYLTLRTKVQVRSGFFFLLWCGATTRQSQTPTENERTSDHNHNNFISMIDRQGLSLHEYYNIWIAISIAQVANCENIGDLAQHSR